MIARLTWITPVAFAALVVTAAACSGGAPGGSLGAVPAAPLSVREAQGFAQQPPIKNGEVLNYTNHYTGTFTVWSGPTASPTSSPYSGTAKNSTVYSYDKTEKIYASTYTEPNYVKTTSFAFAPTKDGHLREVTFSDKTAYVGTGIFGTDFYTSGQLVSILPLVKGASWNDAAADNSTELDQDSTTWMAAKLDGSYFSQSHPIIGSGTATATLRSDGSAASSEQNQGETASKITAGVPRQKGKRYVIPVAVLQSVSFPATPPPPQRFSAYDWYPNQVPQPLYFDRTRVVGSVKTPASCKAQGNVQTIETVETYKRLDTIEAYSVNSTEASYYGQKGYILCQIRNITLTTYDIVLGKPEERESEIDTNVLTSAKGADAAAIPGALASMPVHPLNIGFARNAGEFRASAALHGGVRFSTLP